MKKIPIFFSFDDNYASQAAVTFESLLTNAKKNIFYKLYVLHTKISTQTEEKLQTLVKKHLNVTLTFINVEGLFDIEFNDENFSTGHAGAKFTVETLYRCLPTFVKEFDKYDIIIYSDVDIVVVDDISDLYDIDLENKYIAGVKAPKFLDHQFRHVDKKFLGKYVGGGLWVMNLKKMRKDNLGEKILDLIKEPPYRLIWNDQDVINLACDLKVTYFSYQYVSIPCWYDILKRAGYYDEYYPNKEFYDAVFNPKIVHYAAAKPWVDYNCHSSQLWFKWLKKTDYYSDFKDFIKINAPAKLLGIRYLQDKVCLDILSVLPFKLLRLKTKLSENRQLILTIGKV